MKIKLLLQPFIIPNRSTNYFFRIMKISFILLFVCVLQLMATNTEAQNAVIDVSQNNLSIKQLINEIETQTDYLVVFRNQDVDINKVISFRRRSGKVSDYLDEVYKNTDISYVFENKYITLYRKTEEANQDKKRITGIVIDENNEPVPGASIAVKGTSTGTTTDIDGNFTLETPDGSILVITYIGYIPQEINVGNRNSVRIVLVENAQALEEVVVVGYGTQKKVNLTGSVSAINMNDLTESRPITNLTNALSGMAPGVFVSSSGSSPGNDNGQIMVRGMGTLNDAAPLVIIDGVEGNMSNINPQDVESMSVLKDAASAAIYGSRAANGVILVTTKKGKSGTLKVDYNGYVSFENINKQGASFKQMSNYADYMEIQNESLINIGQSARFSQKSIDLWRANEGGDPMMYPNTDWVKELYQTGVATNHALSFSGGTDKFTFYSSIGYLSNPGIVEKSGFERYNIRLGVDATIKPWISLGMNLSGYIGSYDPMAERVKDLGAINSVPGQVLRSPDGRYGAPQNPEDNPQSGNVLESINSIKQTWDKKNLTPRLYVILRPFNGFSLTGNLTYDNLNEKKQWQPVFIDRWNFQTNTITMAATGRSQLNMYFNEETRLFMDGVARYEKNILPKLNVNIMAGASQERFTRRYTQTLKYDMVDESLSVPDAAIGEASQTGNGTQWVMRSFFGRLNLNWDEKYLLEANLRADGSSRFLSGERWGYFPSISAGWRLDQEEFLKNNQTVNALKLRASYGSLGNNGGSGVGNYDAISTYNTQNYILNNALVMGMAQTAIANALLTWETTYITDIGVDFGLLKNRLTGSVDYFNKKTNNILINLPAPMVHGNTTIPKQNAAEVVNNGLEFSLGWNDRIGNVDYYINGNLTWLHNEVTKFKGTDRSLDGANMIQEGYPINVQYVRIVDRIIQTDEDLAIVQKMLDNAPLDASGNPRTVFSPKTPQKGDLLYKDLNGDGVINDDDRTTVGKGKTPPYTYGINLGASWKGIDFSMLLQGMAGVKMYFMDMTYRPVTGYGYAMNKEIADGRWYEGRTDAKYPRVLDISDTRNGIASDFWVQNKSYLKIRNIQFGYALPKVWMDKIGIERIRVYGSLENFFTFTKYKGPDVESEGSKYPSMKQAVIGLNVSF